MIKILSFTRLFTTGVFVDSLSLLEVALMLHFYEMCLLRILVYYESSNFTDLYQTLSLV